MKEDKEYHPIELLKQTPPEIGQDRVEKMISAFPILPPPNDWTSFINLNSILMTSIGAIILAGTIGFFTGESSASTTEIRQYQIESSELESVQNDSPSFAEGLPFVSPPAAEEIGSTDSTSELTPPERSTPEMAPIMGPDLKDPADIPPTMSPREIPPMPITYEADGSGKRTFDLKGFFGVKLAGSHDVIVEQGPFSVMATGDDKLLEKLVIEVRGDNLHISSKNGNWDWKDWKGKEPVKIYVKLPELKTLALAGSGNLDIGSFSGIRSLKVNLSGSGDLVSRGDLEIEGRVDINLAGSGDINLDGRADYADIALAGSGDISTKDLIVREAEVSVAGSGDVSVYSTGTLDVSIVGSGDVDYYGSPKVSSSIKGSGDVDGH